MQNFTPLLIPFSWDFFNWYLKIIRWENMRVFWPAIFNTNQGRVSEALHIYKAHLSLLLPHHKFHFMFMKRVCRRFRYKYGLEILTTTYAFTKYFFFCNFSQESWFSESVIVMADSSDEEIRSIMPRSVKAQGCQKQYSKLFQPCF